MNFTFFVTRVYYLYSRGEVLELYRNVLIYYS
jgi:hypothetical protein